jgi:hypothetical protein
MSRRIRNVDLRLIKEGRHHLEKNGHHRLWLSIRSINRVLQKSYNSSKYSTCLEDPLRRR